MQLEAPQEIVQLLSDIVTQCKGLLGDNLVGIYLHGSLAMGVFNPDVSDVDFLVVTEHQLTPTQRREMAKCMLRLSAHAPRKGLEMSVITQEVLRDFKYPTPYEFHFGNEWKERYQNGTVDYAKDDLVDGDLAAHVTITKARGLVLCGMAIDAVFPDIPQQHYIASILADARDILSNMGSNPVYNVLNLCRVRAFLEAGLITSKREGGEWALLHATPSQADVIGQALAEYTNSKKREWDQQALQRFGQEMSELLPL